MPRIWTSGRIFLSHWIKNYITYENLDRWRIGKCSIGRIEDIVCDQELLFPAMPLTVIGGFHAYDESFLNETLYPFHSYF